MVTTINIKLPEELIEQAQQLVHAGWATDFDTLLAEALRHYLDTHNSTITEAFIRYYVAWGLDGVERPPITPEEFRAILDKNTFRAGSLPIDFDRDDIYSDHD